MWAQQRPITSRRSTRDDRDAPVEFNACPTPEVEHRESYFQPGETVYLTAFLTDQLRVNATLFNVYTPTGTLFGTTTITSDADYYAASYWQWSLPLPTGAPPGTWRFEVVFNGQTQSVNFQVGATEPPRFNVAEYYAVSLDHYFMTAFTDEQASLDAGAPPGWKRTGESFPAYAASGSGLATVCRFFGTTGLGVNSHFYTAFDFECAAVKQKQAGPSRPMRFTSLQTSRVRHRRARIPALQQRHGRRPQPPLYDELAA